MSKTVLVVGAHADDEALGCAGTMARFSRAGDQIHTLFLTDGVSSRDDDGTADARFAAMQAASKILGVTSSERFDFPDNAMDSIPLLSIVKAIEQKVRKIQPAWIITHHGHDLNVDHRRCYQAVLTACRFQPDFCVQRILSFETLSSTEWQSPTGPQFTPTSFVDITDAMEQKRAAIDAYAIEMRQPPHARSFRTVESLAAFRGGTVGVAYAEAFEAIREKI